MKEIGSNYEQIYRLAQYTNFLIVFRKFSALFYSLAFLEIYFKDCMQNKTHSMTHNFENVKHWKVFLIMQKVLSNCEQKRIKFYECILKLLILCDLHCSISLKVVVPGWKNVTAAKIPSCLLLVTTWLDFIILFLLLQGGTQTQGRQIWPAYQ